MTAPIVGPGPSPGPGAPAPVDAPPRGSVLHVDRVVAGIALLGIGVAWLMDEAGVAVPWHVFPAVGLILVGVALVVASRGLPGRGPLVAAGVVLTVVSLAIALTGVRFTGPVGDRTVSPTLRDWPVTTDLGAGNLTIDLTQHPLPPTGLLSADVGAGTIVVLLPLGADVGIDARVGVGEVRVDGQTTDNGVDVHWTRPADDPAVTLDLEVGAGQVEVRHD